MTDASGQRQRAEALYGSLTCTTYREGYQDPDNDIGIIEQALKTARQEALREAAKLVNDYNCISSAGVATLLFWPHVQGREGSETREGTIPRLCDPSISSDHALFRPRKTSQPG